MQNDKMGKRTVSKKALFISTLALLVISSFLVISSVSAETYEKICGDGNWIGQDGISIVGGEWYYDYYVCSSDVSLRSRCANISSSPVVSLKDIRDLILNKKINDVCLYSPHPSDPIINNTNPYTGQIKQIAKEKINSSLISCAMNGDGTVTYEYNYTQLLTVDFGLKEQTSLFDKFKKDSKNIKKDSKLKYISKRKEVIKMVGDDCKLFYEFEIKKDLDKKDKDKLKDEDFIMAYHFRFYDKLKFDSMFYIDDFVKDTYCYDPELESNRIVFTNYSLLESNTSLYVYQLPPDDFSKIKEGWVCQSDPVIRTGGSGITATNFGNPIARDSYGRLVSIPFASDQDLRIYRSGFLGNGWYTPGTSDGGTWYATTIGVTVDDVYYVYGRDNDEGDLDLLNTSDIAWGSFTETQVHSTGGAAPNNGCRFTPQNRATSDVNGNIHMCSVSDYCNNIAGSADYNADYIFYFNYTPSTDTWYPLVRNNVTTLHNISPYSYGDWCSIATDSNAQPFIVGNDGSPDDVRIWGPDMINYTVIHDGSADRVPEIYIDQSDNIWVTWEESDGLFIANSTPTDYETSWTIQEIPVGVSTIYSSYGHRITGFGDGTIIVEYQTDTYQLYYAYTTDMGVTWNVDNILNDSTNSEDRRFGFTTDTSATNNGVYNDSEYFAYMQYDSTNNQYIFNREYINQNLSDAGLFNGLIYNYVSSGLTNSYKWDIRGFNTTEAANYADDSTLNYVRTDYSRTSDFGIILGFDSGSSSEFLTLNTTTGALIGSITTIGSGYGNNNWYGDVKFWNGTNKALIVHEDGTYDNSFDFRIYDGDTMTLGSAVNVEMDPPTYGSYQIYNMRIQERPTGDEMMVTWFDNGNPTNGLGIAMINITGDILFNWTSDNASIQPYGTQGVHGSWTADGSKFVVVTSNLTVNKIFSYTYNFEDNNVSGPYATEDLSMRIEYVSACTVRGRNDQIAVSTLMYNGNAPYRALLLNTTGQIEDNAPGFDFSATRDSTENNFNVHCLQEPSNDGDTIFVFSDGYGTIASAIYDPDISGWSVADLDSAVRSDKFYDPITQNYYGSSTMVTPCPTGDCFMLSLVNNGANMWSGAFWDGYEFNVAKAAELNSNTPASGRFPMGFMFSPLSPDEIAPWITLVSPNSSQLYEITGDSLVVNLSVTVQDQNADNWTATFYNASSGVSLCVNASTGYDESVICKVNITKYSLLEWYVNATDGTYIRQSTTYDVNISNLQSEPSVPTSINCKTPTGSCLEENLSGVMNFYCSGSVDSDVSGDNITYELEIANIEGVSINYASASFTQNTSAVYSADASGAPHYFGAVGAWNDTEVNYTVWANPDNAICSASVKTPPHKNCTANTLWYEGNWSLDDTCMGTAVNEIYNGGTWAFVWDLDGSYFLSYEDDFHSYFQTYVWEDTGQDVYVKYDKDDTMWLYVNGAPITLPDASTCEGAAADEQVVTITLVAGWNKLQFAVADDGGGYDLYFRLTDTSDVALEYDYTSSAPASDTSSVWYDLGNFTEPNSSVEVNLSSILNSTTYESIRCRAGDFEIQASQGWSSYYTVTQDINVTDNSRPTIPTNITCNNSVCTGEYIDSMTVNCSGSIDTDSDNITYIIYEGNGTFSDGNNSDVALDNGTATIETTGDYGSLAYTTTYNLPSYATSEDGGTNCGLNTCWALGDIDWIAGTGQDMVANYSFVVDYDVSAENFYGSYLTNFTVKTKFCTHGNQGGGCIDDGPEWEDAATANVLWDGEAYPGYGQMSAFVYDWDTNTWVEFAGTGARLNVGDQLVSTYDAALVEAQYSLNDSGVTPVDGWVNSTGFIRIKMMSWGEVEDAAYEVSVLYDYIYLDYEYYNVNNTFLDLGNHTEDSVYTWNLSAESPRTVDALRCAAIDLDGTNVLSTNYTNAPLSFIINNTNPEEVGACDLSIEWISPITNANHTVDEDVIYQVRINNSGSENCNVNYSIDPEIADVELTTGIFNGTLYDASQVAITLNETLDKLVACLPFDSDGSDLTGLNNATLNNTAVIDTVDYKLGGGSLNLSGATAFADITHSDSIDFTTGNFSIVYWTKANPIIDQSRFYDKGTASGTNCGNGQRYETMMRSAEPDTFFAIDDNSIKSEIEVNMAFIQDGEWHMVANIRGFNDTTGVSMWVDSEIAGSIADSTGDVSSTCSLVIGAARFGSDTVEGFANISMDEFMIFNDSITKEEIDIIYNAGAGRSCSQLLEYKNKGQHIPEVTKLYKKEVEDNSSANRTVYMSFDGGWNLTEQENNIIPYYATNVELKSDGIRDNFANGSGSSSIYYDAVSGVFNLTDEYTISLWVKAYISDGNRRYVYAKRQGSIDNYNLETYNGKFEYWVYDGTWFSLQSGGTYNLDEWYHILVTKSGQDATMYVNGILNDTDNTFPTELDHNIYNFSLFSSSDGGNDFVGAIDEFKIYSHSMSTEQANETYNSELQDITYNRVNASYYSNIPDGTIINASINYKSFSWKENNSASYDFDGGNAKDITGNGNDADTVVATISDYSKFGRSYYFDGVNDYIDTGVSDMATNFTLSWWSYTNTSSGTVGYFIGDDDDPANLFFRRAAEGSELISGGIGDTSTGNFALSRDVWHQHTIVHYSNGTYTWYVDNAVVVTVNGSNYSGLTGTLYLGNRADLARDYDGFIDEVHIWDRSLSPSEVSEMYAYTSWNRTAPQTLTGDWEVKTFELPTDTEYVQSYPEFGTTNADFPSLHDTNLTFYTTGVAPTKSGLIQACDAEPFCTDSSNPGNITVPTSESVLINWTVNGTGWVNTTHAFYATATQYNDSAETVDTSIINITIVAAVVDTTPDCNLTAEWFSPIVDANHTIDENVIYQMTINNSGLATCNVNYTLNNSVRDSSILFITEDGLLNTNQTAYAEFTMNNEIFNFTSYQVADDSWSNLSSAYDVDVYVLFEGITVDISAQIKSSTSGVMAIDMTNTPTGRLDMCQSTGSSINLLQMNVTDVSTQVSDYLTLGVQTFLNSNTNYNNCQGSQAPGSINISKHISVTDRTIMFTVDTGAELISTTATGRRSFHGVRINDSYPGKFNDNMTRLSIEMLQWTAGFDGGVDPLVQACDAEPFCTDSSNPGNISISPGGSVVVNWTVNGTGTSGTIYEFFGTGSVYDNESISYSSSIINITLVAAEVVVPQSLSMEWDSPTTDANHTYQENVTYSVNVTCDGGTAGDCQVNVSIDPLSYNFTEELMGCWDYSTDENDYQDLYAGTLVDDAYINTSDYAIGTGSLQLDGASDYATANGSNFPAISTTAFTIGMWSRVSSEDSNFAISKRSGSGSHYAVIHGFVTNKYEFYSDVDGDARLALATGVSDSNWHYIVWTYDNSRLIGYLDGAVDVNESRDITFADVYAAPLYFGTSTGGADYWNGNLDEIQIWNRTLSPAEVLELNNTADGSCEFIVASGSTKSGLIPSCPNSPFCTDTDNPYNNYTISDGSTVTFNWTVNASGTIGTVHPFFANATIYNDSSIKNNTDTITITIVAAVEEAAINYTINMTFQNSIADVGTYGFNTTSDSAFSYIDSGYTPYGTAINFTDNNNRITFAANDTLDENFDELTIVAFMRYRNSTDGSSQNLVDKGAGTPTAGYQLTFWETGSMSFYFGYDGGSAGNENTGSGVIENEWKCYGITVNSSDLSVRWHNGSATAFETDTMAGAAEFNTTQQLVVGSREDGAGEMDSEVASLIIDTRKWSDTEVYDWCSQFTIASTCTYTSGDWVIQDEVCTVSTPVDLGTNYLYLKGTSGIILSSSIGLGGRNVSSGSYVNITSGGSFNWSSS